MLAKIAPPITASWIARRNGVWPGNSAMMMAKPASTPISTLRVCVSPTQTNRTAADRISNATAPGRVPGRVAAAAAPTQTTP